MAAENIKKALGIQYNEDVADSFQAYINDEGFDEETIIEDIEDVDEDDLDNCSIVEHLAGAFPKEFGSKQQKELLKLLQNALKGILPEASGSNVNLIDPNTIQWAVTKQQSKDAAEFITTHCPKLMEDRERNDKALMDVVAIGKKNDIPLLNWLTDTYSRYRVNNHISGKADINTTDWLKKYAFFTRLQQTNKTKTLEKLNSSIKSFFKRMFNQINLANSVSMIDDNVSEFVDYYIAMQDAMSTLTSNSKEVVPFQVDLWIIPRNVKSAISAEIKEDDEDEDDFMDEIGVDCIGNIEHRLDASKFKYVKVENDSKEKTKRVFVRHMEQMLNEKRNQRIMIYVDRRNPKYVIEKDKCDDYVANNYGQNPADEDDTDETLASKMKKQRESDKKKTWNDTLYFVQAPDKLFSELPSRHSAETSFWASTQCMLPKLKNETSKTNGYGCRNDFNGYQFTLSWHCDAADCIRNYFFSNCWGTRFFPADAAQIWPTYFDKKGGSVKQQQVDALKKMEQCIDPGFKHWYENTTKSNLVLFK